MLLAAEPVRLLGREQVAHRAGRPFEPSGGGEIARTLLPGAAVENAGFAEHHHVAHVVGGRADQVDDRVGRRPSPHRFGAGARLAGAPPGENEPDDPVARRRRLLGARPEGPVVEEPRAFVRRELSEHLRALADAKLEQVADPQDRPVEGDRRVGFSDARLRTAGLSGLRRRVRHVAGLSSSSRAAITLSLLMRRSRSSSP